MLSSVVGCDLYRGDIEGEAIVRGIKRTCADGSGRFVTVQRLVGHIGDRFGSFVLELDGSFAQIGATARWTIVPDSGTQGLQSIWGDGVLVCNAKENSYTLSYDLD
nr:hypothetical protein [uncultured bacterium]ASV47018.1 hypothetical protein [uncultured bacterium]